MLPQLLQLNGAQFLLSERFCQDNLEVFFGKQRARGRRNDNPTVEQFIHNSQAIIAQKSLALGKCSNITRRESVNINADELNSPLRKRVAKRCLLEYNT